jgi:DNA-binding MarR family transcriptional regulator
MYVGPDVPTLDHVRRRTDRLYPRALGPRELEALCLIEQGPGSTAAELADELGVTTGRVWQIVRRLEVGWIRRDRD